MLFALAYPPGLFYDIALSFTAKDYCDVDVSQVT